LKELVRGMLFYNTIYWRRASDGLNPPKLTPEERKMHAPPKDLEVIKPRETPRARIDVARREAKRRQMSEELARFRMKLPGPVGPRITGGAPAPGARPAIVLPTPAWPQGNSHSHRSAPVANPIKRRRRRRGRRSPEDEAPAPGFMARLLARWLR
jgi:hypothetical protein